MLVQFAGRPMQQKWNLDPSYQGMCWEVACALQNHIWDSRQTWLRGEKYFGGQWEDWEKKALNDRFNNQKKGFFMFSPPSEIDPRAGTVNSLADVHAGVGGVARRRPTGVCH